MTKDQLAHFAASTVLAAGAEALLPQHLPEPWLAALLHEADDHHPDAGREGETIRGLMFAVTLIISAQRRSDTVEFTAEELADYVTMYSVALATEHLHRTGALKRLTEPTLDTIFDPAANIEFENPLQRARM
jgi:hypothetical protein